MDNKLPHWIINKIPDYQNVEYQPQAYGDSTHKLWRLQDSTKSQKNTF